jgi:hypothetical protein
MDTTKIMAWIIIILMTVSVLGVVGGSFFSEDGNEKYNGFTFINTNNYWSLRINGEEYSFQYLPTELENLTLPAESLDFSLGKVYLGFKPADTINWEGSLNLLAFTLYKQNIMPQESCLIEEGCPDIPIINCQENPGIIIVSGDETSYTQDQKCLIMTATDNQELTKLTERLIYKLLGVMN